MNLPPSTMTTQATSNLNPAGGHDLSVTTKNYFGQEHRNITGGVFAGGNTQNGPPNMGGFASANANGHSLSVTKTIIPGVAAINSHNATANLFKNDQHSINANAFSNTTKMNGFSFDQRGAGVNYQHGAGHAASVGVSKIPGFGSAVDVGAKANIFQSPSTTFDVMANSQTHISGPFQGKTNYNVAAGFTHNFK